MNLHTMVKKQVFLVEGLVDFKRFKLEYVRLNRHRQDGLLILWARSGAAWDLYVETRPGS